MDAVAAVARNVEARTIVDADLVVRREDSRRRLEIDRRN
jgi:hypothetical protein